jgi:hypothetical protein
MTTIAAGDPVALTRLLVQVDSRNPDLVTGAPGEGAVARLLCSILQSWGFRAELQEVAGGRGWGGARSGGGGGRAGRGWGEVGGGGGGGGRGAAGGGRGGAARRRGRRPAARAGPPAAAARGRPRGGRGGGAPGATTRERT